MSNIGGLSSLTAPEGVKAVWLVSASPFGTTSAAHSFQGSPKPTDKEMIWQGMGSVLVDEREDLFLAKLGCQCR